MYGKYCFFILCVGDGLIPEYHGIGFSQKKGVATFFSHSCFDYCIRYFYLKFFLLPAISVSVLGISVLKAIDQPERDRPGPARISCSPV